ncbi:MAG: hypothetical protein PHR35_13670 [Kiritimatiellae bacterium]|nr:hypothetical protein [Kiritimatiellia bacterium]
MKPSPQSYNTPRQRQLACLEAWIREWKVAARLEREATDGTVVSLRPDSPRQDGSSAPRADRTRIGAVRPLTAGAIVLLPPDAEYTRRRPVYVALVGDAHPGAWLAVPFGRFQHPATPGELATGRPATPLKVLCLWNRGPLEEARLRRGWRVGTLTSRERGWVACWLTLQPGETAPAALQQRLGPPLIHPLDPRHQYLQEERCLWLPRPCLAEKSAGYAPRSHGTLPMAAETPPEYE